MTNRRNSLDGLLGALQNTPAAAMLDDDELSEFAAAASDFFRSSQTADAKVGGVGAAASDRIAATTDILRREAEDDPWVRLFRTRSEEERQRIWTLTFGVAREALLRGEAIESDFPVQNALQMPGQMFTTATKSVVAIPLEAAVLGSSELVTQFRQLASEARRLAGTYGIRENFVVLYLCLDRGFVLERHATWRFDERVDRPCLSRLHLSLDPSLSPEEVALEYRHARKHLGILSERQPRLRTCELARDASNMIGDFKRDGVPLDWKVMLELWNNRCRNTGKEIWAYDGGSIPPKREAVYEFTRDVKEAIASVRDRPTLSSRKKASAQRKQAQPGR